MKLKAVCLSALLGSAFFANQTMASGFSVDNIKNRAKQSKLFLEQANDPEKKTAKDDAFRILKSNVDKFIAEAERRGYVRRSAVGGIVGHTGGVIRKLVGGKGSFAGAMGGIGAVKGASSGLFATTGGVLGETISGIVLGRTCKNEIELGKKEIVKLRNIEQVMGGALGGTLSGVLGGAILDGVLLGTLGGATFVVAKKIVGVLENVSSYAKGKKVSFNPKEKNILTIAISGALAGGFVGAVGAKGTLGMSKEALIAAIRGAVRGLLTEEEEAREAK
ncbi:MAG: hypothetical protein ACJAXL_000976 [Alphaproteobacteria bacterium]|jgi:hypothetical protein